MPLAYSTYYMYNVALGYMLYIFMTKSFDSDLALASMQTLLSGPKIWRNYYCSV